VFGKNMKLAIILSVATLIAGCATQQHAEHPDQELIRHFNQLDAEAATTLIDSSDGITEVEAYKIANNYLNNNVGACGAVGLPQDDGLIWRVPVLTGVGGIHTVDLIISKTDGSNTVEYLQKK
jgi:hypothetical protein